MRSAENSIPRVGIVTGQLSHGGAERQLYLLAQGLALSGKFTPVVFCLSQESEPYGSMLSANHLEWHVVPKDTRSKFGKLSWLVKEIQKSSLSILYGILNVGNVYAGAAARCTKTPYIGSIRNSNSKVPLILKTLSSISCKHADYVIANSNSAMKSLQDSFGVRHDRVRIIPNAVSIMNPEPAARVKIREAWGITDHELLFGTVALLKPEKRPGFYIDIYLHLIKLSPAKNKFQFVWVGEGTERCSVEKLLTGLPKSIRQNIHFPGERDDITDCLSAFDVFILSSAFEGSPNALLEAMSVGLPCVATDVKGTQDVFQWAIPYGEVGMLADPQNPERFAQDLMELLRDPQRMKSMGKNAKRYIAEKFTLEKMIGAHIEVFIEVLSGTK